ncbi:Uncharacterised protein [Vibrio cholerae]|nr:Uncharacterised protein [Vibrio cholerae]
MKQLFHWNIQGRGDKNRVIASDYPENAFGFTERVEQASDQLCRSRTCADHHQRVVVIHIQH